MAGFAQGDRKVPGMAFLMNELTMVGCSCYDNGGGGHEFAQAAAALAANPEIAAASITHRFPLAECRRGVPGGRLTAPWRDQSGAGTLSVTMHGGTTWMRL